MHGSFMLQQIFPQCEGLVTNRTLQVWWCVFSSRFCIIHSARDVNPSVALKQVARRSKIYAYIGSQEHT